MCCWCGTDGQRAGTVANDAPAITQHGEQQQHTYSTVPDLLQHTTLQLVLQREDEEQEQHEQIADGVEGTPDGAAQQHGGNSSAHSGQQVGAGDAGLYVLPQAFVVVECRFIRRPHLHQTRRTGAGESLAPRLLATRYYYRTRPGDTPEKTASRNCAASS